MLIPDVALIIGGMTTTAKDLTGVLESLLSFYTHDPETIAMLLRCKDNLSLYSDSLPPEVQLDLHTILNLHMKAMRSFDEMQQANLNLKGDVQHLRHKMAGFHAAAFASHNIANAANSAALLATTKANAAASAANAAASAANAAAARVEQVTAWANVSVAEQQQSKERLTIRQVYHALNEKLLLRVLAFSGLTPKEFWALGVTNIGKVEKHVKLLQPWSRVQSECKIKISAKDLWENITEGKSGFDSFVHKGSFQVVGYEALLGMTERIFVGEFEKFKPGFLELAALSKSLSEKDGKSMFDY